MKKNNLIVTLITVLLFLIPFFWFKPGETDFGGDSSRLFYYDPLSYLQTQSLYGIVSSGVGGENVGYYGIPFLILLWLIKLVISSPAMLVSIFNGVTLSLAFLSSYLIIKDILILSSKKTKYIQLSAILSGLFYIFSPTLVLGWDKAILTHFQFFLNPLMFLLLFRFITRNDFKYLFLALIVSFIFPANFTFVAAPPFFAFYPLSIVFLLLYTKFILKRSIPFKSIGVGLVLFVMLHLFHLGSHISSLLVGGSQINQNVFSAESMYSRGLSYFVGLLPNVKASFSWLNLAQMFSLTAISYAFIIFPIIILLGFIFNKTKQFLLTGIFFLVTFFFVTANVTDIGVAFYQKLFDIPGFSMFRNFFGQWVFVFTFFYMLLFGQAIQTIFEKVKRVYVYSLAGFIIVVLCINAWPFINGSHLNKIHYQSKDIRVPSEIDPEYEKVLTYIRGLDTDGKFISFPTADAGYQTLSGKNGGAYQGPSTISYLAGKNDFTGYDGLVPFHETFLTLVKNNDIERISRLFSILNIRYVFYNSDPAIYDDNFPKYPFTYVRETMPKTQKEYGEFLAKLPIRKVKDFGKHYHIYEVNDYLPHFYTSNDSIYASDALTPYFTLKADQSPRTVVFTDTTAVPKNTKVILEATNINPLNELNTNYHLHVHEPFISRRPDDPFYPIVVRREKETLEKKQTIPNDYIDFSLLYLAKRIFELEKFKQTPITMKQFNEPQLWEMHRWREYYSWESNLSRFETDAKKLITWINNAPVSQNTKDSMHIKLNESFSQHELRLKSIIKDSKYEEEQKKYLTVIGDKMFSNLYNELDLKLINNTVVPYSLKLPQNANGQFVPYLRFFKEEIAEPSQYKLVFKDVTVEPVNDASKGSLLKFNNIDIKNVETGFNLQYIPSDLLGTKEWMGIGKVEDTPEQTILEINNQLGPRTGFSREIDGYIAGKQYIITFDYFAEGDDVLFKLTENQYENGKFNKGVYFNKLLTSRTWKKQQFILTASIHATAGFIQFLSDEENYSGKLHLRNLTVTTVPNGTVLFEKVTPSQTQQPLPTIQFKKINPTRYTVHVANAKNPYSLVFLESFSDNWKLYANDKTQASTSIAHSYFNGEVQELKHENTFFDPSFLQNTGSLVTSAHLSGNGYANVWNIKPEDAGGKDKYTFDVIYQPQITFYYYLAVSLITFIALVASVVYLYIQRK